MIKVVFVDFDGTLVDTMKPLWGCYKTFLAEQGIQGAKKEFDSLIGPSIPQIVASLKTKHCLKLPLKSLQSRYRFLVEDAYSTRLKLFPHASNAIKSFKDAGLKIAIVTASPKKLVQQILEANQLSSQIDCIIVSAAKLPPKPDPAIYLKALRRFKVSPGQAIAIEDSLNGVKSARGAGIFTILLTHNQQTESHKVRGKKVLVQPLKAWKDVKKFVLQRQQYR